MDRPCAVGIVGSRRRNSLQDRKIVFRLLAMLYGENRGRTGFYVVSGGAWQGADSFAKEFATKIMSPPLTYVEFPIDREGLPWETDRWKAYQMFTERAYARNRLIAQKSWDGLYCLVADDRKGGTENTIKHALELGTPVFLVTPSGEVYLSADGKKPTCAPVRRLLDSSLTGSASTSGGAAVPSSGSKS